jgi:hypothetical protein
MNSFEERWWQHFIPECYFDTVLIKKLLQCDNRLIHRRGCHNVINDLKSERLKESFAVAIIDKDKNEVSYLTDCKEHYSANQLILMKHKQREHYVIQLNPPLEKWIISVLDSNGLKIEDFGYSREYKKLKRQIKYDITSERDDKLGKLTNAIIKTDCNPIKALKTILLYLKEKNIKSDVEELKKLLLN